MVQRGSGAGTLPVAAASPCDMARVSVGNSSEGSSHVVALGPHCPKKLRRGPLMILRFPEKSHQQHVRAWHGACQ